MKYLLFLILAVPCYADDALPCFSFSGPSAIIVTHPGEQFIAEATFSNECPSGFIDIGLSFGSDVDPYLALDSTGNPSVFLFDPQLFLAPGDSVTAPFALYQWGSEVPLGYLWTGNIFTAYRQVEQGTETLRGFKSDTFTVNVVPEPSTALLFLTGLPALAAYMRKRGQNA